MQPLRAIRALRPQWRTSISQLRRLHTPWFIDSEVESSIPPAPRRQAPHIEEEPFKLPDNVPEPVRVLYNQLSTSPYLEPSTLIARSPLQIPYGPPLPERQPKGKRSRGRTHSGSSMLEHSGGIWNWVVMAQVKEGTENRGSIESVVRVVRKTLLGIQPPLPLPPNSKQRLHNGWAMIDAGNFAVHIMSKETRVKYFQDVENRGSAEW